MKYSILGFNQELVIQQKQLNVDDLLLLDYIYNAIASPSMEHILIDDIPYVWLQHKKIHEDLPILNISEDRLKRKLKKLIELDLLQTKQIHNKGMNGSKAYYAITIMCDNLRFTETGVKNNTWSNKHVLKTTRGEEKARVKNNTSDIQLNNNIDIQLNSSIINNTTVDFLNSAKQKPKESLYSKAIALINNFTDNTDLRNALKSFLDLQLEIYRDKGKVFYINTFKNRLNKLKEEFDETEYIVIVNYAVSKGWQNFYAIPDNKSTVKNRPSERGVVSEQYTDEELRELEKLDRERAKKGLKTKF